MEDPEDIEKYIPKESNAITPDVVAADNNTLRLDITLFPINWGNSVLDVMDPWFWLHTYQPELQVMSSNSVRGLPSWHNSLLNVLDPWCWFHTRGISIQTVDR